MIMPQYGLTFVEDLTWDSAIITACLWRQWPIRENAIILNVCGG